MTDKRARGRPKTRNRERTLAAATQLYWEEGPDALTISDVCRRAGISKPSLYREFGNEDGLMDAVLVHYQQLALVPLIAALEDERTLSEVLDDLVVGLTSDRGVPAGCLFAKMRITPHRLGPKTRRRIETIKAEMRAAYRRWICRSHERGELNPDVDVDVGTHFLDTQITTLLMQMSTDEEPDMIRAQARVAFAGLKP